MVRNLGVISVLCFCNICKQLLFHDPLHKSTGGLKSLKPADVTADFLCHCAGKHSRISSRIGGQLLFIQVLCYLQRLVGTDFKSFCTFRLQLRKIKQKWCLFSGNSLFNRLNNRRMILHTFNQCLRIFFLPESIFLIQKRRLEIFRAFYCFPLPLNAGIRKFPDNPVKRSLFKIPDFPLTDDNHAEHAGHDTSHSNWCIGLCSRCIV